MEVKKYRAFEKGLFAYLATHNAAAGAHHVRFTPGSDKLIIVMAESRILIVDLTHWEEERFEVLREFGHHRGLDSEGHTLDDSQVATVISLDISSDGQWLVTGDDLNRIHVFNLDNLKVSTYTPDTKFGTDIGVASPSTSSRIYSPYSIIIQ